MADPDYSTEIWKPIPGLEEYEVSSFGRVRSIDRVKQTKRGPWRYTGRIIRGHVGPRGYLSVRLTPYKRTIYVHHAVLMAFRGERPDGMEACHNDGDQSNNSLANLRWDTPQNNLLDKIRHGRIPCGEKCKASILTEDMVREIRNMVRSGRTQYATAKHFGIHDSIVYDVVHRKTWKHVD